MLITILSSLIKTNPLLTNSLAALIKKLKISNDFSPQKFYIRDFQFTFMCHNSRMPIFPNKTELQSIQLRNRYPCYCSFFHLPAPLIVGPASIREGDCQCSGVVSKDAVGHVHTIYVILPHVTRVWTCTCSLRESRV